MRWLAATVLAVGGCWVGDFSLLPNQLLAERTIWRETYGMHDAPPPVDWIHETGITGTNGAGGLTLIGWKVEVACRFPGTGDGPTCNEPIQLTAYPHELYHWWCWVNTGDVDVFHSHCDWSAVDRAYDSFSAALEAQAN